MNTSRFVPAGDFSHYRRHVIRTGGAIVRSVFVEGGFYVTVRGAR